MAFMTLLSNVPSFLNTQGGLALQSTVFEPVTATSEGQMATAMDLYQCLKFLTTLLVMSTKEEVKGRVHSLFTWNHGMLILLTFYNCAKTTVQKKIEPVIFSTPCGSLIFS